VGGAESCPALLASPWSWRPTAAAPSCATSEPCSPAAAPPAAAPARLAAGRHQPASQPASQPAWPAPHLAVLWSRVGHVHLPHRVPHQHGLHRVVLADAAKLRGVLRRSPAARQGA
jgi:hypothetical protein